MLVSEGEVKEFLGQEFLTWLWYRGETNSWCLNFGDSEQVSYGMDELLVLEPEDPNSCSQRLAGPVPVNSPEAQIGLQEGKKVSAVRIVLVYKEREWSVTWRANNFHFSSLKLMKPTTADPEDRFAELADDLENALAVFDRMYNMFLEIRLSPAWEQRELPAIYQWIKDKQQP